MDVCFHWFDCNTGPNTGAIYYVALTSIELLHFFCSMSKATEDRIVIDWKFRKVSRDEMADYWCGFFPDYSNK